MQFAWIACVLDLANAHPFNVVTYFILCASKRLSNKSEYEKSIETNIRTRNVVLFLVIFSSAGSQKFIRCPTCRTIASSFRNLFVDQEFCEAGDASARLAKHLTEKHGKEMTELKVTYGTNWLKLEKENHELSQKIAQLEEDNRELRQTLRFATLDANGAQRKLLQIFEVLKKKPRKVNAPRKLRKNLTKMRKI